MGHMLRPIMVGNSRQELGGSRCRRGHDGVWFPSLLLAHVQLLFYTSWATCLGLCHTQEAGCPQQQQSENALQVNLMDAVPQLRFPVPRGVSLTTKLTKAWRMVLEGKLGTV